MATDYCVVITTYADNDVGKKIINGLLEQRLAACIQAVPISSYYHWKGEINNDNEMVLFIKSKATLFPAIEEFIRANHDYECPEIVMLPIDAGFAGYLEWINNECQ